MDLTSASAIVTAALEAPAQRPCAGSPRTDCTGLSPRQRSRAPAATGRHRAESARRPRDRRRLRSRRHRRRRRRAGTRRRARSRRSCRTTGYATGTAAVDLYWLPLGAGGHFVRLNGRVYEALASRLQQRPARDLYHSALQVELPEETFVIEQAPVHDWSGKERGVVAEGAVGARWAGRFRIFRYEIRLWRGGHIPDVAEAVDSPRRLSDQEQFARRLLEVVPRVPTPVWGRDELGTGEMWNSNSVIAWAIARSGIDAESIQPPQGGRAPGWRAGAVVAHRRDAERADA